MPVLSRYAAAWVAGDPEQIAAVVAEDCVVQECWGPVYRGRISVRRWARQWFGAGGVVHEWAIEPELVTGDGEAATWTFDYTWQGRRDVIMGASIARIAAGSIVHLREYRTTGDPVERSGDLRG